MNVVEEINNSFTRRSDMYINCETDRKLVYRIYRVGDSIYITSGEDFVSIPVCEVDSFIRGINFVCEND